MPQAVQDPPLPPGFKLTSGKQGKVSSDDPPLPPGYQLNQPAQKPEIDAKTQAILDAQRAKYPTSEELGGKAGEVAPAPSPYPESDTGIIAGAKRGLSNLNPMNILDQIQSNVPTTDSAKIQQQFPAFEAGLQHMQEHPVSTALQAIPMVGPWVASLAERLPHDPFGTVAEAATTAAVPYAAERGMSAIPGAAEISGRLKTAADANRMPLPRRSILDAGEVGARTAVAATGGLLGNLIGHPQAGAAVATVLNELRRTPEWRGLKASTQEAIANNIVKLAPVQGPEPPPSATAPPQEYQQPGVVRSGAQGWTGGPSAAESPIDVESTPVKQGMLTSRGQQLALPAAPTGPPQLQGGPTALAPATDAVPITPDPRLPASYRLPVEAPAPPGIMGSARLGEPGPIPAHGEQTVTPVKPGVARNDIGQFRRMTREEAIHAKGTAGRTAAAVEKPTPPPKKTK